MVFIDYNWEYLFNGITKLQKRKFNQQALLNNANIYRIVQIHTYAFADNKEIEPHSFYRLCPKSYKTLSTFSL